MKKRTFVDLRDESVMENADPVLRESLNFCRTQLARMLNNLPADTDWPPSLTIAVSYIMGFGEAAFGTVRRSEGPIISLDALNPAAMRLTYPQQLIGSDRPMGTNAGVLAWANKNLWDDFVLMAAKRDGCLYRAFDTKKNELGSVLAVEVAAGADRIREEVMASSPGIFRVEVEEVVLRRVESGDMVLSWEVEITMPESPGVDPTWGMVTGVTCVVEEKPDA